MGRKKTNNRTPLPVKSQIARRQQDANTAFCRAGEGKHEAEEANIAATKLCDETKKILEESQLDVAKMKIEVLALERAKKTISEELENLQRENQFMEEAHRGQLAIIRSKISLEKQVASLELQVVNPSVIIFSDYCYFYFY